MTTSRLAASTSPQSGRGFTVIELMITVAIVAVLAMVAVPAYFEQVRKSRRADAMTALSQVAQAQERWRANNPAYHPGPPASAGLNVPNPSSGYYTLTVDAASSASYSATATAAGAQLKDTRCATFTLAASGGQFTYSATPAANSARCWSR